MKGKDPAKLCHRGVPSPACPCITPWHPVDHQGGPVVSEPNSDKANIFLSRVNFSKGLQVPGIVWILTVLIKCMVHSLPKHFSIFFAAFSPLPQPVNQLSCFPSPRSWLGGLQKGTDAGDSPHSLLPWSLKEGSCQGSLGTMG